MNNETKEYLIRLIAGVRAEAKEEFNESDDETTIPPKWLDALLLCDMVEKELYIYS